MASPEKPQRSSKDLEDARTRLLNKTKELGDFAADRESARNVDPARAFLIERDRVAARNRALGREVTDEEMGGKEPPEMSIQEILKDPKREAFFGELFQTMHGDEADGFFERLGQKNTTAEDLQLLNKTRHEFEIRWSRAEQLREGLKDDDVIHLAQNDTTFESFASLFKDRGRAAALVRDHFYHIAMSGDTTTVEKIAKLQEDLKKIGDTEAYKKANAQARELINKYKFTPEQFGQIEEIHWTKQERKDLRKKIFQDYGTLKKTIDVIGRIPILGSFVFGSISARETRREIASEKGGAHEVMKEHFKDSNFVAQWWKIRRATADVAAIEDSYATRVLERDFAAIGSILGASISSDDRLRQMLIEEAEGGPKPASAFDDREPTSLAQMESGSKKLTEANFTADFKKYLARRKSEGIDLASLNDHHKDAEIERFKSSKEFGNPKRAEGFFLRALNAMRNTFFQENKALLKTPTLWA